MDVKVAAQKSLDITLGRFARGEAYSNATIGHLFNMNKKIQSGEVSGEKAHRWLGYIQGVLVARNLAVLEELKAINKAA